MIKSLLDVLLLFVVFSERKRGLSDLQLCPRRTWAPVPALPLLLLWS